jgi:hypothetical protein
MGRVGPTNRRTRRRWAQVPAVQFPRPEPEAYEINVNQAHPMKRIADDELV